MDSEVIQFIHKMSGMWSRTNPGAVAEDMRLAGYTVVSAPKSEQSDRLDKLEAMLTDVFRQLRGIRESRNDGLATLNNGIDDLRQRIEGRFAKAAEEHALDVVATDARMDRLSCILNEHEGRVRELENYTGLDVRSAPTNRQAYETEKNKISKAMLDQVRVQPTIKGGWINMYRLVDGVLTTGILHETRADADSKGSMYARIACIRIPDFTEGEGL